MNNNTGTAGRKAGHRLRVLKQLFSAFICLIFAGTVFTGPVFAAESAGRPDDARPSRDGQLTVSGTSLINEQGEAVTLRGFSTHGLTWYPDYVNESLFSDLSENWGTNIVRLAMYSDDYVKNREENLRILRRGIDAAIQADMYVLVDWHILDDYNPLINQKEAEAFFELIAEEYAGVPNILYEICNEPNRDTSWDDVYAYAQAIIPIIRRHSPQAVIIVGTPQYDQDLESPLQKPLDDANTMYCFHFYTSTHHDEMMAKLSTAVDAGLPVFITECGITEADGDGPIDYEYAVKWFDYLHEQKISYVVWNLSNKQETSSFIRSSSGAVNKLQDDDLTECGTWIRALMKGEEPSAIPAGASLDHYSFGDQFRILLYSLSGDDRRPAAAWPGIALLCSVLLAGGLVLTRMYRARSGMACDTYDDLIRTCGDRTLIKSEAAGMFVKHLIIYAFLLSSMIYLVWRIVYSISVKNGWLGILCNVILLIMELIGFFESCIHYANLMHVYEHPLPKIKEEDYPDVDIFIATYNEPEDLLYRTINGCRHLKYPDRSKVHIWVCDDNRRPSMRALAESMGVGYFDRENNKGAKAGNLNRAMERTSSPYVITLDADMIVRSSFLMETIPYFVYAEQCAAKLPEDKQRHLGLLQTPQCFYDPDVFQYSLYSEHHIPNEQDFFYRTIEVGKASTNSVIYGGSNTILSRKALEAIGGFYEGSITEDFATGLLIESAGFLSLALDTPYASGRTPNTFREHIKQRTRWGRGVINTANKLHLIRRKGLSLMQKLSYLSSVIYWYSPIKNLVYILSPLMFAVFMIPVFRCTWLDLIVFWLPMFILQDVCLRVIGRNTISLKWSAIYETSVMPYLLMPVLKETFGISLEKFQVTDKSGGKQNSRKADVPLMIPFLILIGLTVIGIIRVLLGLNGRSAVGIIIILFWLIRNLYSFIMVLFMINGRDSDDDTESVHVQSGEIASIRTESSDALFEGITTMMTEHSASVFLDESELQIKTGDVVRLNIIDEDYDVALKGIVTGVKHLRYSDQSVCDIEILDFGTDKEEYLQILYDRIPTLPQSLSRDFGLFSLLWRNIIYRLMRTV